MDADLRQQRAKAITRTTIVGAVVNLILSVVKVAIGLVGHSYALVADGIHSFSDLLTDALVWFAGRQAAQAPDQEHPYGHGRYETMATLVLGLFLALVAIGIGWDAAHRLFLPDEFVRPEPIALIAAALSIVIKEWLYWYTLGYARRVRSDMLRANAWHHRTDAISSVVVLVGIGGTLAGLPYLDTIAAFLVALMIGKIAWELGWEAIRELVDTGLEADRVAAVRETILSIGGVGDLHMLRTRSHGGYASADVHVLVDPRVSVSEGHMIAVQIEQRLKQEIDEITDVTVHIDPEDDDAAPANPDLPARAGTLERLDHLWSGIDELDQRDHTILHYLGGVIEVEVFFGLDACGGDAENARALGVRLNDAVQSDPSFGRVTAYFGT